MVLRYFFVDAENILFRVVDYLYVRGDRRGTCPDRDVLAFFYHIHQLIVAVPFNGGFKWSHVIAETGTLDIGDHLVHNTDQFLIVIHVRQCLNGYACFHISFLLFWFSNLRIRLRLTVRVKKYSSTGRNQALLYKG